MAEKKRFFKKQGKIKPIYKKIKSIYRKVKARIKRSIKLQILFAAGAALILSLLAGLFVRSAIRQTDIGRKTYITYEESKAFFESRMIETLTEINDLESSTLESGYDIELAEDQEFPFNKEETALIESTREDEVNNVLSRLQHGYSDIIDIKYYLADSNGDLIYQKDYIQSINIVKIIQKVNSRENISREGNTFSGIYPITLDNEICYLFVEGVLMGENKYYYNGIPTITGIITGIGVFILLIFKFAKYKIDYIEYISHCLGEISKGNLSYQIEILGEDELAKVAKDITYMEGEIKRQIEAKLHTEKLKNELVTNVAHDLRTPLTSIIGYIGLVRNKQFESQEEADKYIQIAYQKSETLKGLIEDLFELTKLHQEGISLNKQPVSMTNLMQQLAEELLPLANEKEITLQMNLQVDHPTITADIPKMTRVFENLMENAIKYSQESDTIYIEIRELKEDLFFAISNKCNNLSQEELDRLFDRFYRTDKSRNSVVGGSGLGLAIVKSIIELHGGIIKAKLKGEMVSFMIKLPKSKGAI